MKRRKRNKKNQIFSEVSLTPLIDTALTLLIIFMITAPMVNNAIKVQLPKGQAQEVDDKRQDLVVHINDKGQFFFKSEKPLSRDELIGHVKEAVATAAHKTVFVKADASVQYGTVLELVDSIKVVGGVEYVALATQRA